MPLQVGGCAGELAGTLRSMLEGIVPLEEPFLRSCLQVSISGAAWVLVTPLAWHKDEGFAVRSACTYALPVHAYFTPNLVATMTWLRG